MTLYACWFKDEEWSCFIIAATRGRAKSLFWEHWKHIPVNGEFTDIRCCRVKSAEGFPEGIHDANDETLAKLGVKYMEEVV